jgi:RNA polymerase sigma factor (sigma-70 family)
MSDILKGIPEAISIEDESKLCAFIRAARNRKLERTHTYDDDINTLVLHNLREAVPYALFCCRCSLSEAEVLSLCYTALRKAAVRFKPGGIRFFAYAKQDVRGEIARYWKSLKVVHNAKEHESEPVDRINRNETYGDRGEERLIEDDSEGPIEPDYVEPEFDKIHLREQWEQLVPLLRDLNARERMVIMLHYESGFSRKQIADMLVPRVTRQTIDNIYKTALGKLRSRVLHNSSTCGTFK